MIENCIVGVELLTVMGKAFEVCIKGKYVYVQYSMLGMPEVHRPYHASVIQHTKKDGKFVEKPRDTSFPELVITRIDCEVFKIGWKVANLSRALSPLTGPAQMLVNARGMEENSLLVFRMNVVGLWVKKYRTVLGSRIIQTHRFGTHVQVEVEAFQISEAQAGLVSIADV